MLRSEVAAVAAPDPVDAVAVALYQRNYDRIFRSLRREFSQWPEDLCHDAIIDALEEIRRRGLYHTYSSIAEGDFVKRSRLRAVDRARREIRQRAIAPMSELPAEAPADADELSRALEEMASTARLRELVLPLRPDEARFVFLTALQGLSRDEAAARMGLAPARARRMVTATHKRLVAFYTGVSDGTVHLEFEHQLRLRLERGDEAAALTDPAIKAHLQWCDQCGELLGRMDRDLQAVAPFLGLIAAGAAKGGFVGAIFGGSAAGTGGGSLLGGGLTAGKTIAVVCAISCTAGGAVVAEQAAHGTRSSPSRTDAQRAQPAQAPGSSLRAVSFAPRPVGAPLPTPVALHRAAGGNQGASTPRVQVARGRAAARPRTATAADVDRMLVARTTPRTSAAAARSVPATSSKSSASTRQTEDAFGLGGAGGGGAGSTAPAKTPAQSPSCFPGDLGC